MNHKKPEGQQNEWLYAGREEIKEIILWICAFALLFFALTYGAIFLIDNTSPTLHEPIPLVGGDG
jgi:hypothetical protein